MELYVAAIRGVFICESDQFIVFYWNRADRWSSATQIML